MSATLGGQSIFRNVLSYVETFPRPFGIDIISLINASIFIFAIGASVRSAGLSLYRWAEKTFLVSVIVHEEDAIYRDVLQWMENFQFTNRDFLSVKAVTSSEDTLRNETVQAESAAVVNNASSSKGNNATNYNFLDVGPSIKMQPFQGSRMFRFQSRWMLFKHSSPNPNENIRWPGTQRRCTIELQCLSLSLKPIQQFLEAARLYSREVSVSTTSIWRAIYQGRDIVRWKKITSRPSRDISTVILDRRKKQMLLDDVNEYLRPQTRRWYANHGIPYRRGYLFSGPPGTGKTSLASALAGVFGLDIYVLSLQDPNINESVFQRLLSEVPPRCIVLLEDIDVAGMTRSPAQMKTTSWDEEEQKQTKNNVETTAISLSCLLNAVDGVSSQEGRILVMSTNYPEHLDKALTRPGRVDVHINFELPSQEQIHDLFLSIYSDIVSEGDPDEKKAITHHQHEANGDVVTNGSAVPSRPLAEMAEDFAKAVPEKKFSVAEVQGFLLNFKRRPEDACQNIDTWVEKGGGGF